MTVGNVIRIGLLAVTALMPVACDVHQFPDEAIQENVEVRLHLEYDTDLPDFKTVTHGENTIKRSRAIVQSDIYDVRYTIRFFQYSMDGGEYDRQPVYTKVLTRDDISTLDCDVSMMLHPGHYKVMVWTDYVAEGSDRHLFYNPDDFSSVTLVGDNHTGNNDYRDVFCGDVDLDLRNVSMPTPTLSLMPEPPMVDATVISGRPLAKFRVITTDLDKFLERSKTEPENFRVVIKYPGYMPSTFNMHTGKPSDSSTGKRFEGVMRKVSEGKVELGYDYVLVNGTEASVEISIEVYDEDDSLLSSTGVISVPLMRSRLTTLVGEFLTVSTQGGVTVDPSYDGEFNIIIP